MKRLSLLIVLALTLSLAGLVQAQTLFDVTSPGDPLVGVPDDGNWPGAEQPPNAIDDNVGAKYLCFKTSFIPDGDTGASGFRVTPSGPKVVIKALNFATANDAIARDPVAFTFSGSDEGIDGPYTLIAEGTIDELNQATALARNTWINTPVEIKNNKAYTHYELMFTELRDRASANSMQIGEVELLSDGSKGGAASNPSPEAEVIDVPRDVVLGWSPSETASTRDLYFGTNFDDVNNASIGEPMDVLLSPGQTDTSYDLDRLDFGQTYFWRVDEVNGAPDFTKFKGDIWSFTVEPTGRPIENITVTASSSNNDTMGPEKTIDGSGLNELDQHSTLATDMWLSGMGDVGPSLQYEFDKAYKMHQLLVWNSNQMIESFVGLGAKDVTVEYSADGAAWTVLEGATLFNQAAGSPDYTANTVIEFDGVMAQFVKITVNAGWGMLPQHGISEVRFLYIPTFARLPEPADGSAVPSADVELSWRAGREAASHEVYLGTDPADLALAATTSEATYAAKGLDFSTTYSWSITEVNEAEAVTSFAGDVWSFTTPDFATVDDFEQYDDNCNRIFFAWEDGLGHSGGEEIDDCDVPASNGNGGGSIVGNAQAPFAEETIVNAGSTASMPLNYDNNFGPSETTLTLGGQDWTASGIQTLSLAFRGTTGNTGNLYVKINNTKVAYDGPAVNLGREAWQIWNIVLANTGASLNNVNTLSIGVDGGSAAGMLYIDDIRLYAEVFGASSNDITTPGDTIIGVPNDQDWPTAEAPEFAIDDNVGTKYLHFKGPEGVTGFQVTPSIGATVVTGLSFTTANDAAARDPIAYELSGSSAGIDGPYTVIAAGDIVDFSQATEWPRQVANETQITFDNSVAYTHYQIIFTALRDAGSANSMQIAEVSLLGEL